MRTRQPEYIMENSISNTRSQLFFFYIVQLNAVENKLIFLGKKTKHIHWNGAPGIFMFTGEKLFFFFFKM